MERTNQIIVMTPEQLEEFVKGIISRTATNNPDPQQETGKRFVYGLRGISELFGVSHVTAQKYKDTFLSPAIIQRGRKIMVDVDEALKLYREKATKC